jgi:hypothetical protein
MASSNGKIKITPVTFKQMREMQRMNEIAHLGPGYIDTLKPFGSDVKGSITFGNKYKFKPDQNPPVGAYEADKAIDFIKPHVPEVKMCEN